MCDKGVTDDLNINLAQAVSRAGAVNTKAGINFKEGIMSGALD